MPLSLPPADTRLGAPIGKGGLQPGPAPAPGAEGRPPPQLLVPTDSRVASSWPQPRPRNPPAFLEQPHLWSPSLTPFHCRCPARFWKDHLWRGAPEPLSAVPAMLGRTPPSICQSRPHLHTACHSRMAHPTLSSQGLCFGNGGARRRRWSIRERASQSFSKES